MTFERITAADVRVGDVVGTTQSRVREVVGLNPGSLSVYITLAGGARIRPAYTTKLWRAGG